MSQRPWLRLAGGGVVLALAALLVFGSAAFAQTEGTTGTDFGQAFIDKLAEQLGLSSEELETSISEAQNAVIDDAVASGELNEEQAEVMRERVANGGWFGFGPRGGGPGGGGRGAMGVVNLETIAETLGITSDELRIELEAGATLSEVITAHGSTVEAVVAALVADAQVELDAAVADGRLTQEEADDKLADLSERLTERIESGAVFGPGFGDCPDDGSTDDAEETETSSI